MKAILRRAGAISASFLIAATALVSLSAPASASAPNSWENYGTYFLELSCERDGQYAAEANSQWSEYKCGRNVNDTLYVLMMR